jgi:hypothetical protein
VTATKIPTVLVCWKSQMLPARLFVGRVAKEAFEAFNTLEIVVAVTLAPLQRVPGSGPLFTKGISAFGPPGGLGVELEALEARPSTSSEKQADVRLIVSSSHNFRDIAGSTARSVIGDRYCSDT